MPSLGMVTILVENPRHETFGKVVVFKDIFGMGFHRTDPNSLICSCNPIQILRA